MKREFVVVIVNAFVWGLTVIACAIALKDTGAFQDIQLVLGGGAIASLLVVAAGLRKNP